MQDLIYLVGPAVLVSAIVSGIGLFEPARVTRPSWRHGRRATDL